jgi:uncharacterized cysteine cluster protein YcgN (CxxCxxCC family)
VPPRNRVAKSRPFWKRKTLAELTTAEWESLCDGCGRCCLKKLEDATTRELAYTDVACKLLDRERCRCTRYAERTTLVPDCVELTAGDAHTFAWLPTTCAYRKLAEGKPLEWWHPLVSGDPDSVHRAGISVRGRTLAERDVADEDLATRIVAWVKSAPLRRKRS